MILAECITSTTPEVGTKPLRTFLKENSLKDSTPFLQILKNIKFIKFDLTSNENNVNVLNKLYKKYKNKNHNPPLTIKSPLIIFLTIVLL